MDAGHDAKLAQLIIENATEYAIFTFNLDGAITAWSRGAERSASSATTVQKRSACLSPNCSPFLIEKRKLTCRSWRTP